MESIIIIVAAAINAGLYLPIRRSLTLGSWFKLLSILIKQ